MSDATKTDPDLPPEYQDHPEPGSREFRLAAMCGYCTPEEAERVLFVIESDPIKERFAIAVAEVSFVMGAAAAILGRGVITRDDVEDALRRVGLDVEERQ